MFDKGCRFCLGCDMYGAHAHRMGDAQIARIILEHGRACWVQAIEGKDRLKGGAVGFRRQLCVFYPIDRIK